MRSFLKPSDCACVILWAEFSGKTSAASPRQGLLLFRDILGTKAPGFVPMDLLIALKGKHSH